MLDRFKIFSLFLMSIVFITYELFIMRVFSVGSWSNFGSLIISTALLGVGFSGTLLTFIREKVRANADKWLYGTSLLFLGLIVLSHMIGQLVPFNPIFIGSDSMQIFWIGTYYIIYGLPFFVASLFIGVAFITFDSSIYQLYFWNMLGSGLGGIFLIILMYFLPTASLILPILLLAFLANISCAIYKDSSTNKLMIKTDKLTFSAGAALLAIVLVFLFGNIKVSEYKPISYVKKYPIVQEVHQSFGPTGEINVFASSMFHFAPGLSDNAVLELKKMPKQAFWGMYIDGNGPIGIMGKLLDDEAEYMDYLPMAAPYTVLDKPACLLVNVGGGISAQVAKYKGASQIDIVERNPEMVKLLRDNSIISAFNGKLLSDPGIKIETGEPRAHCLANPGKYDLVEISLIDSIGLSDSGGYPIHENYTYTVEAITEYMKSLESKGFLSITVWNRLNPPRNVLRLLSTIVESLKEQGVSDPSKRIFMFDLFLSTATILVKNSDITESEVYDLTKFANRRSFNIIYYPGIKKREFNIDIITKTYKSYFSKNKKIEYNDTVKPSDLYHIALHELLEGRGAKLLKKYVFNIKPMRDSRPYYSGYLKLGLLPIYMDQIKDISEEWGYILILGILIQSIFFGFLIILVPIILRRSVLFANNQSMLFIILYYSCLGLGYMLVEMFLMQKLVFFLSDPIFSVSIVITAMLIISGIGNLVSSYYSEHRELMVRIACGVIIATMFFYIFGLDAFINFFRDSAMFIRIILSVLVIAPSAFFLGVPFPNGLTALTKNKPAALPWALGMNGGFSVAGTALAQVISVSSGFPVLLIFVCLLYGTVAFVYPVNELSEGTREKIPLMKKK